MSDETSDKGPGDRRAHRPDPRYTEGDLVRVVQAMNQAEAEFVQALLREEGIPSMLRRTRGFDVADMLAAARDVMVPHTPRRGTRGSTAGGDRSGRPRPPDAARAPAGYAARPRDQAAAQ